jgi:hypothetical protein
VRRFSQQAGNAKSRGQGGENTISESQTRALRNVMGYSDREAGQEAIFIHHCQQWLCKFISKDWAPITKGFAI